MKVLILSDLHLGSAVSRTEALLPRISQLARQFDRVILNGDSLDRCEREDDPLGQKLKARVADACLCRGGAPEFLTGNHDPAISQAHSYYLPEPAFLAFHGDCVRDCTHPDKKDDQLQAQRMAAEWQRMGGRPRRFNELVGVYRRIQHEHLLECPRLEARSGLMYMLRLFVPPYRPLRILHYVNFVPRWAAELGRTHDQPVRHIAIGHTHWPGRWKCGNVTVYNTGSLMPMSRPHAVICEGPHVRFEPLARLLSNAPVQIAMANPQVSRASQESA